jgi:steroid delta-isomerase-like uncharacterized protein
MATDNIALVRRFIDEVWNKGNLGVADELSAKDTIVHEPTAKDLKGVDAFKKHVERLRSAFPDLRVTIEDISSAGDKVFLRWTATGTNKGSFMGSNATNKRCVVPGITENRLENGKLVETWMSYDVLGLIQQLGLAAPSPTAAQAGAQARPH